MPRVPHRSRTRALLLSVLLGAAGVSTFTVAVAAPAGAGTARQTGPDLQQQAATLSSQISANAQKLDAINEQINGAQVQLQQANATIADAQARIAAAKAQANQLQALVEQRAVAIYQSASDGASASLFSIDPSHLASSQQYTKAASDQDDSLIAQLDEARQSLSTREKQAQQAKAQAEKEQAQLSAAQAQFQQQNAQYNAVLGQVKGQLVSLVQAAQQQQAAEVAGPGATRGGSDAGLTTFSGPLPHASGGAGQAIAYAQAQLGRPYCYAGTGPGCFDCSGLTMMAWGSAGVGMSHFSGAQYDEFPHVPMNALEPGDLVFTADPGQHVGLYVGGGEVIHAPHTGTVVSYIGVGYFSLAARP